jgi:hypothetical protein
VVTPQRLTGRAFGLSANVTLLGGGLITVGPTPDTGEIVTTSSSTTTTPCVATLSGIVGAHVLCANVTTVGFPGKSTASASVADVGTAIAGVPTITIRAAKSTSTTTCAGSSGTTTIDYLAVGSTVVIAVPTQVAPNTTINVGVVKLVLNEQLSFSTPDKGLTVNAVHATVNTVPSRGSTWDRALLGEPRTVFGPLIARSIPSPLQVLRPCQDRPQASGVPGFL